MPSKGSLALHAVMIASHHGIDPDYWGVKEVWYVDDYDAPLPPKAREYYWDSDDVLKRIKEMKDAGCAKTLVPQRTFVLVIKLIMEPDVIFPLEKSDLVEVLDHFESLPVVAHVQEEKPSAVQFAEAFLESTPEPTEPSLRLQGINVCDYDRYVLKRSLTGFEVAIATLAMLVILLGAAAFGAVILAKIWIGYGVIWAFCVIVLVMLVDPLLSRLVDFGLWVVGIPPARK